MILNAQINYLIYELVKKFY